MVSGRAEGGNTGAGWYWLAMADMGWVYYDHSKKKWTKPDLIANAI